MLTIDERAQSECHRITIENELLQAWQVAESLLVLVRSEYIAREVRGNSILVSILEGPLNQGQEAMDFRFNRLLSHVILPEMQRGQAEMSQKSPAPFGGVEPVSESLRGIIHGEWERKGGGFLRQVAHDRGSFVDGCYICKYSSFAHPLASRAKHTRAGYASYLEYFESELRLPWAHCEAST